MYLVFFVSTSHAPEHNFYGYIFFTREAVRYMKGDRVLS